jgi:hypothetical protein
MKILILTAALLMPGAALAGTARSGADDAKKGDQLVCRNLAETGSRLVKKRVCMTRDEWAEQKRAQREELERTQNRSSFPGAE